MNIILTNSIVLVRLIISEAIESFNISSTSDENAIKDAILDFNNKNNNIIFYDNLRVQKSSIDNAINEFNGTFI